MSYLTKQQADDKELISELASQSLSLPVYNIKRLGGCISYNYEINHKYIVKLPSNRTNPEDWIRQARYTPKLQESLSFEIPASKTKNVHSDNDNSIVSLSYPKIGGVCFDKPILFTQKDKNFKIKFFEQLADAAHQIHKISPESIPVHFPTKLDLFEDYYFKSYLRKKETDFDKKLFRDLAYNADLGFTQNILDTSTLIHSDLHSGNIVLDGKNKLVGILDFDSLGKGAHFLEFRPELYQKQEDTDLFQKIYSEQTGIKINQEDVDSHHQFYDSIQCLAILFQLYDTSVKSDQKLFLKHFNKWSTLRKDKTKKR